MTTRQGGGLDVKLDAILARRDELASLMAAGGGDYAGLGREFAELEPIVSGIERYRAVQAEIGDLTEMLDDARTEPEMRGMAKDELAGLEGRLSELERELQLLLLPRDAADDASAILEIRAGTGGDEAALFAGDLWRMYERYAQAQGWRTEILSLSETEIGGVKELVAEVQGRGVFARLKFEAGVHRVQRVPVTETGGRIHTSAATVAVLPEAEDVDLELDEGELRVDVYRASGAGGQHVNKT
ncbi:MAG: PCRF domain-containing protein, partial [Geminicoccaceae bacterium]|nr:PCRF domain-containing protein [Geminicoccaceae bacterium]